MLITNVILGDSVTPLWTDADCLGLLNLIRKEKERRGEYIAVSITIVVVTTCDTE